MQFGESDATGPKSYPRAAFHLPPEAFAIQPTESGQVADSMACGDGFDVRDL